MSRVVEIHALMYTATCGEILEPVIARLAEDTRFRVTATAVVPVASTSFWRLAIAGRVPVSPDRARLEHFVSTPGDKILLLVADWDHPAHTLGREAVHVARSNGIPSLSVQHGAMSISRATGQIHLWNYTADRMAVWGTRFRDLLASSGSGNPDGLVVTGSPRIAERDKPSRERTRVQLGIRGDRRVGLIATSTHSLLSPGPGAHARHDVVKLVSGMILGMHAAGIEQIIVRPHPAEIYHGTVGVYVEAAEMAGVDVFYSNCHRLAQPDLLDVLSVSDVLVTQGSTTALYAVQAGVPAVSVRLSSDPDALINPYPDGESYTEVESAPESVSSVIEESVLSRLAWVAEGGSVSSAALEWFEPGDATSRIANLLHDFGPGDVRSF